MLDSMTIEALRPYQRLAIEQARDAIRRGASPVVVVPTGGGKTHIASGIVRLATDKGRRVLWLAHRLELIDQAAERLAGFGLRVGVIMAGRDEDRDASVQVASVQTLVRRQPVDAQLVIVDEAHHIRAATYQRILDGLRGVPLVGLTATPRRLDGKGLGQWFGEIVAPVSVQDLIDAGHLVQPRWFQPERPDLRKIRKTRGDYEPGALAAFMLDRRLVGNIAATYQRLAPGCKGIVFACGIQHSLAIVADMQAAGIRAEHLDGTTPKDLRTQILRRLRDGELDIVSNVAVLTEGWDLPSLEVCIVARPTASWSLHVQMVGRIMRRAEQGKQCIVLDHAGNIDRHGLPTDPVEYSLADEPDAQRGQAAPAGPRIRTCTGCFAVLPAAQQTCPLCGLEHVPAVSVDVVAGDLKEISREERQVMVRGAKAESYAKLVEEAMTKGYRLGWAARQYRMVWHVWPRGDWFRQVNRIWRERCRHVTRDGRICVFCFDGAATFHEFLEQ